MQKQEKTLLKNFKTRDQRRNASNFFVPRKDYGDEFTEAEIDMIKKNLTKERK